MGLKNRTRFAEGLRRVCGGFVEGSPKICRYGRVVRQSNQGLLPVPLALKLLVVLLLLPPPPLLPSLLLTVMHQLPPLLLPQLLELLLLAPRLKVTGFAVDTPPPPTLVVGTAADEGAGATVGFTEGLAVGTTLVGAKVGVNVGKKDRENVVGFTVGTGVGKVGLTVGVGVGFEIELDVGEESAIATRVEP